MNSYIFISRTSTALELPAHDAIDLIYTFSFHTYPFGGQKKLRNLYTYE